jgi:YVTN family beta-propeller protein
LPSGEDPETFAMNPAGDQLYVSNEDDNLITVIDINQAKAIKTIPDISFAGLYLVQYPVGVAQWQRF